MSKSCDVSILTKYTEKELEDKLWNVDIKISALQREREQILFFLNKKKVIE